MVQNKILTNQSILIVEDHNALRSSLKRWLSVFFQEVNFLEAESGEEALVLVKEHKPCIALVDIKLPQMNGIEATQLIKEINPDTKIVILSMYDIIDYKNAAFKAGATAYVTKHMMYNELIPVIKEILSS